MRLANLFVMSLFAAASLTACGDDGGSTTPDAAVVVDAAPDAPAGLTGLGKKCDIAMGGADCPTNAPACVGFQGTTTYCSPVCVMDGTAVGGMNGQFASITPMPNNATCSGAYTGTVGMPACAAVFKYTPMDATIVNGKNYTEVNFSCVIGCGASNACPAGMAANTSLGACLCLPT